MKVYQHESRQTGKVHTIISELDGVRTDRLAQKCAAWASPNKVRLRNGKIHIQGDYVDRLSAFVDNFNNECARLKEQKGRECHAGQVKAAKEYANACKRFAAISPKKSKAAATWHRIAGRAEATLKSYSDQSDQLD